MGFDSQEQIVAFGDDSRTPAFNATGYGSVPSTSYVTYATNVRYSKPTGIERQGAGGSHLVLVENPLRREPDVSFDTMLSNTTLLAKCIPSATTGKYTSQAILTGKSNRASDAGQQLVFPLCKPTSWRLTLNENGIVQFSPTFAALGYPEEITSSLKSPTYSDLATTGNPATWASLSSVPIELATADFELREVLSGLTIEAQTGVQRSGTVPTILNAGAETVTSRRAVQLNEGQFRVSGSATLRHDIDHDLIADAVTIAKPQSLGDVVFTLAGATITLVDVVWGGVNGNGGQPGTPFSATAPLTIRTITIA